MKNNTITVFVEKQKPIQLKITESTTCEDVLKLLKITTNEISCYASEQKDRPCTYLSRSDKFTKTIWTSGSTFRTEWKKSLAMLWVGFWPGKYGIKQQYTWVGNIKKTLEKA